MRQQKEASGAQVVVAMAIVYIVWGSTYLGIKVAVETTPPLLMAAVRFLAAGALLHAWTVVRGAGRATRREWMAAAASGILMLVGGVGAVTVAEQHIDSGVAALLVASVPLWMAVLAWAFQGERLRAGAVVGLLLGFAGVALLVRPSGHGIALWPSLLVLAGTLSWAIGSLYVRRAPLPVLPLRATSMQMLSAGAVFGVLGTAGGELGRLDVAAVSRASLLAIAYLTIFGSVVALSAYTWLLRTTAPATVSTYAYVNPAVAVVLGALLLGEAVTRDMVIAGGLIVAGVALIVTARARKPPAEMPVAHRVVQRTS